MAIPEVCEHMLRRVASPCRACFPLPVLQSRGRWGGEGRKANPWQDQGKHRERGLAARGLQGLAALGARGVPEHAASIAVGKKPVTARAEGELGPLQPSAGSRSWAGALLSMGLALLEWYAGYSGFPYPSLLRSGSYMEAMCLFGRGCGSLPAPMEYRCWRWWQQESPLLCCQVGREGWAVPSLCLCCTSIFGSPLRFPPVPCPSAVLQPGGPSEHRCYLCHLLPGAQEEEAAMKNAEAKMVLYWASERQCVGQWRR